MRSTSTGGALPADSSVQPIELARTVAAAVIAEIQRRGIVTPEYLDSAGAAVYMGMSIDWLAKARCEGFGPPYSKVSDTRGGAVRYKRSDLDKFMADRREKGGER